MQPGSRLGAVPAAELTTRPADRICRGVPVPGNPRVEWTYETPATIPRGPAVADGTVFVGNTDGTVHAVNASDGNEEWTFDAEDLVGTPAVADGTVYAASFTGKLHALDASSGSENWTFGPETDSIGRDEPLATAVVADGRCSWGPRTASCTRSTPPRTPDGHPRKPEGLGHDRTRASLRGVTATKTENR